MSEELCILNGGVQTVAPQLAAPQVVYLDFDGAATSYVNADLGVAIDNVTVDDSGISESDIAVIVDALNGMFDDVVFSSALPSDGEFSTIYVGVTSAFDEYGSFLGLAETIDSGNQIHDDNAFVLLDSSASAELVVSVIAHETEHIVHGMDHGGEGLERFAEINVGPGQISMSTTLSNDRMNVYTAGMAISTTVNAGGVMDVYTAGQANSTTVNAGGVMNVYAGAIASSTTLNKIGKMYVYSGGQDYYTTVNILGSMHVYNGGLAFYTTVNSGGVMHVYSSGMANAVTVAFGGVMSVYIGGIALFANVVPHGHLDVFSGGTATDTTMNGGGIDVYRNGTATDTTMNGGWMFVYSGGTA